MKQKIILWLTFALISTTVFAQQTYVFEGDGNWNDPNQWKNNEYPGLTVSSGNIVEITGVLTIPNGITVTNEGKIEAYNTQSSTPEISIVGSLINNKELILARTQFSITGELITNSNSTIDVSSNSKIVNEGTIKLKGGVLEINSSVSDITNKGLIHVEEPSKLTINAGKLINNDQGTIDIDGALSLENGESDNEGKINVSQKGSIVINGKNISNKSNGEIVNLGSIKVNNNSSLSNSGTLTNKATILIDSDSFSGLNLSRGSVFVNQGTDAKLSISDKSTIAIRTDDFNLEGGTFVNNGKLDAQNKITVGANAKLINNGTFENGFGGKFYNNGTFEGLNTKQQGDLINGGILSPGNSSDATGLYKLDAYFTSYTQTADGSLNIDLGGTTEGDSYDQLVVNRSITLDGTLNVNLVDGFEPAVGDTFTIINGSRTISGTFSTLNLPTLSGSKKWDTVSYDTKVIITVKESSLSVDKIFNDKIKVTVYPNPASEKLFVSGLSKITEARIYDIRGNEIVRTKLSIEQSEINLEKLKSGGVYLLYLNGHSYKFVKK